MSSNTTPEEQSPSATAPGFSSLVPIKPKRRNREIDAQLRSVGARARFLAALRKYGVVGYACSKAGVSRRSAYQWRETHPEFGIEWDTALIESTERLEREAVRRGCDGVSAAIFDRNGNRVGSVTTYSDRLLEFVLTARDERYNRTRKVEMSGAINVASDDATDVKRKLLALASAANTRSDTVATE